MAAMYMLSMCKPHGQLVKTVVSYKIIASHFTPFRSVAGVPHLLLVSDGYTTPRPFGLIHHQ